MFAKWYEVNGVKCQGNVEKNVAEMMVENNHFFSRGKAIKTPFGNYTPDFDCDTYFVEVKTLHSWLQALGVTSLLENAKKDEFAKLSNNSQQKMEWVNENVKPVYVYIEISENSKKFKDVFEPSHTLSTIKGNIQQLRQFLTTM
jgi:hypothetical protein